ncbi:beta-3 adrenergic receptor-like [Liolophura sinensis]|uniref:beta-3 adrenergic receptor-like n=1 Tax=Liolophura sinensis TaxID=3198878 RepID=UPI003158D033
MNLTFNVSQCKGNTTNDVGYTTVEIAIRSAVVLLVSVTIILSNLLNFVILWTIKNISPVTKVFLINLTTADFCTGLIGCLPAIAPAINGTWPYGAIWCQISAIVHGSCSTVSIWSVGVIGVERYIATSYPVFYKNKMTQKRSLGIVCLLWTSCLILFVAPTIIKGWLLFTSMWMANSNCFVNVIIYSAIYPSFRFRLKTIL